MAEPDKPKKPRGRPIKLNPDGTRVWPERKKPDRSKPIKIGQLMANAHAVTAPDPASMVKYGSGVPVFRDAAAMDRLEARLRQGASFMTAFRCEGISHNLMHTWRIRIENEPDINPELVAAYLRLAKARGHAAFEAEKRVFRGQPAFGYWLERMERGDWLPPKVEQKVEVSTTEEKPLGGDDIRAILSGIATVAKQSAEP